MSSIRPSSQPVRWCKTTATVVTRRGVTASARRISRELRLYFRRRLPAFSPSPFPFVPRWSSRVVIKAFRPFPHNAATDETFEHAQRPLIFGRNKADRIADGVGAAGASDAMDIILRVHRKIIVHHMRDPIHIDAEGGDVGGDEDTDGAGLEILQRAEPLVLRAIGMDRARLNSAAFETTSDLVGAALGPGENKNSVELRIAQEMKQ